MMALKAGINASKIVFSGVGKTTSEISFAIDKKILLINAESLSEIKEINRIAKSKNKIIKIGKGRHTPNPKYKSSKPNFTKKVEDLQSIGELNRKHQAREYLEKRQIPQEKLSSLYYTDRFKTWINSRKPGTFKSLQNDRGRIIIPLIDREGKWFGVQGRSLLPNSTMRYITIIFDEDKQKVFGINHVKEDKPIYIVEGPIDSLFLDNSVAMVGSDFDPRSCHWSDYIWVYDNEPRNRQIVDRISHSIDRGDKVVIWPQSVTKKDINDMILVGQDPQKIIETNTYQGIQAKIKLTEWKRV